MTLNQKSNTKREVILEAASRLFYEQGYNQTGIQQILDEAGAAKGTFYSFFKSKELLGVAWLKNRHHVWNQWLRNAIDAESTPGSKILAAFDFLGDWMKGCNFRGCAFLNTLSETPEPDSPLRQQILEHKSELRDLFQTLTEEHHVSKTATEQGQVAAILFLLFEGTIIEMQNFRELWPLEAAKKQVQDLL